MITGKKCRICSKPNRRLQWNRNLTNRGASRGVNRDDVIDQIAMFRNRLVFVIGQDIDSFGSKIADEAAGGCCFILDDYDGGRVVDRGNIIVGDGNCISCPITTEKQTIRRKGNSIDGIVYKETTGIQDNGIFGS